MFSNNLTKITLLAISLTVANLSKTIAKTGLDISQQFTDSVKANVSESNLSRMREMYYNVVKRKTFFDSLNIQIANRYPKGDAAALVRITQDEKKVKDKSYTLQDFKNIPTDFSKVDFNNNSIAVGYYYKKLTIKAYPLLLEEYPIPKN